MDVISIISDGFNVYFPMAILAFCLATYFSLGSRLLSMLGFQQFLDDDEFTTDLVEEGQELIKRGKTLFYFIIIIFLYYFKYSYNISYYFAYTAFYFIIIFLFYFK